MIPVSAVRRVLLCLMAIAIGASGVGCSSGIESQPAPLGLQCVDDSKHCIDQRSSALHAIMSDKERRWVREQPTPQAFASGVRLFAFKTRKRELTCDELAIGQREADSAPAILRGPGASQLSPAQVSRGLMLGAEVSRELAAERKRRCRV
jgi:hypothetical protein